jgi:hypothetical protein
MIKLIKYVLEPGVLTLTFLLENGEELVVPIPNPAILNQMELDLLDNFYDEDKRLALLKITRTIDPSNGAIVYSDNNVEYEGESLTQAVSPVPSVDFPLDDCPF